MALYFLNIKTFGRTNGSSAASAIAYRAGERIRDERTGKIYDHSDRQDVMHKEIILPTQFTDDEMAWARDRASLWNAAESAETRKNARVAREYLVALPVELSPERRLDLVRGFAQELSDRYKFAIDFAIHAPRNFPGSDPRNFHAHMLATTREVGVEGLGAKTTLELNDDYRRERGLEPAINELFHVRQRWAAVTNEALQKAHIATHVDHRSLEAQGIDREPLPRIPQAAFEMERHGYRSVVAERLRDEYQAKVMARQQSAALSAAEKRDMQGPNAEMPRTADTVAAEQPAESRAPNRPSLKPQNLEEIRRQARENWLRLRQAQVNSASSSADRVRDDDLSR